MQGINDAWDEFEKRVIPASAHHIQRGEMKKGFYAGALVMLTSVLKASDLEEGEAEAKISSFHDEIQGYYASIKGKRNG